MDIATIIGLVVSFGLMIFGMVAGDAGVSAINYFLDVQSALITFGGALGCLFASFPMADFISGIKAIGLVFKTPNWDVIGIIKQIIDLSNVARKEGLLALEESANNIEEPFMKKGIIATI